MNENNTNKKRYIIIGVIIVILLVIISILAAGSSHGNKQANPNTGTVTLDYNTTDIASAVVKFNGKIANPTSDTNDSATYTIAPNAYTLSVTNPGYTSFSTNLGLKKGQTVIVDVHISINTNSNITSIDQITLPGIDISSVTITNISYFYNKTWAVIGIQAYGNTAIVVTQYNAASAAWATILGPGTSFTTDSTQGLPQNVQDYLIANNYINPEGQ